jgi:hypothetical protein
MVGFICILFTRFHFFYHKYRYLTGWQVRDQQTSAALGLPPRIRDEDCQIADLEPSDFEESGPIGPSEIFRAPPDVHISYVIGMSQLARLCMKNSQPGTDEILNDRCIVREVVASQYLPGRSKLDNPTRPMLHQRLVDWEANLRREMQFQTPMKRDAMFLVGMLHMAYKYAFCKFNAKRTLKLTQIQQFVRSSIPTTFPTATRPNNESSGQHGTRCSNQKHSHFGGHALRKSSSTRVPSFVSPCDRMD